MEGLILGNKVFRKLSRPVLAMPLGLALAACGGGGGGDDGIGVPGVTIEPARDTMTIASTDVEQVGISALDSVAGFGGTDIDDFVPFSTSGSASEPTALHISELLIERYLPGSIDADKTTTLAGATQVDTCDLGQGTVAYTEEGDEGLVEFDDCLLDNGSGYSVFNGSLYLSGNESGAGCSYGVNGLMVFAGLTVQSYEYGYVPIGSLGMNGRFNFSLSGDDSCADHSFRLYGPAWEVIVDGERLAYYDFDITASSTNYEYICTVDYQATIDDSALDGSLDVSTPTTVEGYCSSDYPYTGVVRVDGAGNSRMQVVINTGYDNPNALTLDADLNGDGFSDAGYPVDMSWEALETAAAP